MMVTTPHVPNCLAQTESQHTLCVISSNAKSWRFHVFSLPITFLSLVPFSLSSSLCLYLSMNLELQAVDAPPPPLARWWVLLLTCVMSALQCAQWSWPGPIAGSLQSLYNIDGNMTQLLLNYGPIVYLIVSMPCAWYARRSPEGVRGVVLTGIALVAVSSFLRMGVRSSSTGSLTLLHIAQILNAAAGPPAMASVTALCEIWFHKDERATATALAVEANVVGATLAFIAGPLMVSQDAPTQAQVDAYNGIYVALCGATALAAAVYFPVEPTVPPSLSAAYRERQQEGEAAAVKAAASAAKLAPADLADMSKASDGVGGGGAAVSLATIFWREHVALLRNPRFMILCFSAGFLNGAFSAWSATLAISGAPFGIDNVAAGWIGAIQSFGGNFAGIAACLLVDRCRVPPKRIIVASCYASVALLLAYILQTEGLWPAALARGAGGTATLWIFAATSGVALNTAWPVFVDASADEAFPVPEATSLTLLTNVYNLATLIFLLIPIQGAPAAFVWAIFGSCAAFVVFTHALYRPGRARRAVDDGLVDADEFAAQAQAEASGVAPRDGEHESGGSSARDDSRPLLAVGSSSDGGSGDPL